MNVKESLYEFQIETAHFVKVTYINHPHSFYVRAANVDNILQILEEPGRKLAVEEIHLGKTVVYLSNSLRKYVRGEIRFISKAGSAMVYDIFAKDYGCIDTSVPLEDVHAIGNIDELKRQTPPLAVQCLLDLCEPKGDEFTPDVVDAMKFYVGDGEAEIIIKENRQGILKVVLKTPDCPGDVATMMGLLHKTVMTKAVNQVNKLLYPASSNLSKVMKFKMNIPKIGETLHVRVLGGESLSFFHVAEVSEYKMYLKEDNRNFTLNCKNQSQLNDLRVGMSCGVNAITYTTKYERAFILKISVPDEKALVLLIDLGKEKEVPFSRIKPVLQEHYFEKPALAILCAAEASQSWPTSLPKFLYPGYEFVIRINEVGNGIDVPHKVNLFKIRN